MRDRLSYKMAKLILLDIIWNHVITTLMGVVKNGNNNEAIDSIIKNIPLIPKNVRMAALKFYLCRCYSVYFIVYMEWLLKKENDFVEQQKIKRSIKELVVHATNQMNIL